MLERGAPARRSARPLLFPRDFVILFSRAPRGLGADFVRGAEGTMNWFKDHPVLIALVCSGVAVAYGVY